ncbi:MAG: methyltransferase domain-containing protein [Rhodobacteraceae bacterium]|nr:methyltransferase domain-containing protein [Paracoccaceae bacterium]
MNSTARFWDGIAEKYARSPIKDQTSYAYTLERTASYLKSTDRVLELGCGTGTTALKLAGGVAEIVATDVSSGMIAVAHRRAKEQGTQNVTFESCPAETPPQGPFDAALAFNLLHLVEDLDATLQRARDSLKPGGLLISKTFCTPKGGASFKYRIMRVALPVMQFFGRAPFVRFISADELDRAVERAGFELIERESFPQTDARRFLVARRV